MIRFLHEITDEEVGGKAKGLQSLREIGLKVPGTVVLIHPTPETLDDEIVRKHLQLLGDGPKAVRSSAVSEDGHNRSFAGQFESYLDLTSYEDIRTAILRCIQAAEAPRVKAYSEELAPAADLRLSVILQNMVDARVAGVVFTADPVSGRRDKVVVNAVAGKGEALVSGSKDAHHYQIFRSGSDIRTAIGRNGDLLDEKLLKEILEGALQAEKRFGTPVDLEWAIDRAGVLHWLQVRPVTALDEVHYNELDTVSDDPMGIWTLGNIGEMMPGVATPLTASVSAEAIDVGMAILADAAGAFRLGDRTGPRYIQQFYNRLFINMTHMMDYPKHVWMNKASDVMFALSGKVFPGIDAKPESPLLHRIVNLVRQLTFAMRSASHRKNLEKLAGQFRVDCTLPLEQLYHELSGARALLGIGFGYHLGASAQSGTLYSAFIRIMTGDKREPVAHDHHVATTLLLNIPDIESADAVRSLEKFAHLIREHAEFAHAFTALSPDEALASLREDAPAEIRAAFSGFLARHGHRCVRESELREKTWGENPVQLIRTIQKRVSLRENLHHTSSSDTGTTQFLRHLPFVQRLILKAIVPAARKAVARREITKGLSIRMVSEIRTGYRALANKMFQEGLLEDTDQVFFLTHEELGQLIRTRDESWKEKASKRRRLLAETAKLKFNEICFGIPEPIESTPDIQATDGQLKGTPVSRGIIEGTIRCIHSLDEAEKLKEGEIMAASFTDIGWTPYFSIIGGLITEIGSPLSHGAVVAREYGIPAVVGVKGALNYFRDGERVRLNGDTGIVEKI